MSKAVSCGNEHTSTPQTASLEAALGNNTSRHQSFQNPFHIHGKSKGYRRSVPTFVSIPCKPESMSPHEYTEMSEDAQEPISIKLHPQDSRSCLAHQRKPAGDDDASNEANASSDGASSTSTSYGDMDIDPAALEEVCKAYDV